MLSITLRTDKPEAEIGLFDDSKKLGYQAWQAHRQLAETLHRHIENLLKQNSRSWHDLEGIVCFRGPGSFTGLRIGLTMGNALANGLKIPIVSSQGDDWIQQGINRLKQNQDEKIVLPEYGGDVFTTKPRK